MPTTFPVLRWQIGDVRVARVVEFEGPTTPKFLFEDLTKEKLLQHAWLRPHFLTGDGKLIMSIHAFVVESRGSTIVVDTCVGNDKVRQAPNWHLQKNRFLEDLAEAGCSRERVTHVLCTHLHVDHVGWNTMLKNGRWLPTFPNARYLFGRREYEYWSQVQDDYDRSIQADSVRPIVDAGLAELVETGHKVTPEVFLEPTPGHTPGHVSVRISSKGQDAVITGDLMHHPAQCSMPEVASRFDYDPDAARRTRREFLARYDDGRTLVLGTHFAAPAAGRVALEGGSYRLRVG